MRELFFSNLNTSAVVGENAFSALRKLTDKFGKIALIYTHSLPRADEERLLSSFGEKKVYALKLRDETLRKTLKQAEEISAFLSENGFNRSDVIVASGGGTVCDLVGFVASVYMRGLAHITVPTTILCACDACIGGKTAIDACGVKNGWGAFHQPIATVVDAGVINALPDEIFTGGLSEVVKYALLDGEFFKYLNGKTCAADIRADLCEVIAKCLEIKAKTIADDIEDNSCRRALNLGHTVAHAIELKSGYLVPHSQSVAQGIFAESAISFITRRITEEKFYAIYSLLLRFLPNFRPYRGSKELISFMKKDKKNGKNGITFALPTQNSVEITAFSEEQLKVLLR